MKRIFTAIIIVFILFTLYLPVYSFAVQGDDGIPDNVRDYVNMILPDNFYADRFFQYKAGKTTADTLDEDEDKARTIRENTVCRYFLSVHKDEWLKTIENCEKTVVERTVFEDVFTFDGYYIPEETVAEMFSSIFGKGYEPDGPFCDVTGEHIFELTEKDGSSYFLYYNMNFENGGGDIPWITFLDVYGYEYKGDCLYVYVNYCEYFYDTDDETEKTYIYGDTARQIKIKEDGMSDFLNRDTSDSSYYAQYRHTFKSNGDGGYYWYSTELIGVGGKPVDEVIPSTDDATSLYPILAVCSAFVMLGILIERKRTYA